MDETNQADTQQRQTARAGGTNDVYQACINLAHSQSLVMAKRWFTQLAANLLDKSTTSLNIPEKRQVHVAWEALTAQQAAIEQGFPLALSQAITQYASSVAGGQARQPARSMSALRFDDLELMGDAQVQDTLDEARLQQLFLLASDAGFTGFSARFSTAQGFQTVKTDKNPLRPEVFASALVTTLQGLNLEPEIKARWLVYGGQIMGDQLQLLYTQLQDMLEKHGVRPAAYTVKTAPDDSGRSPTPQPGTPDNAGRDRQRLPADGQQTTPGANVYLSREKLLTLDHLHRLMSGEYDESFSSPANIRGDQTKASDGKDVTAQAKVTRNSATPRSLGQSLAMEVVGLMIEQLATDTRLLPPVRQMIANAEPAFLKLGLSEPRFFSDKNHPARRLLEAITAKSLAYNSEDAAGFADYMGDLQNVAALLIDGQAGSEQDFEAVLQDFEARYAKRNEAAAAAQKLAVQALLQAEQRNLLAEKIALEIRQRSDFVPGNNIITAFVTGPWAQVMAKERMVGEHGGLSSRKAVYSLALGDMLWSIDFAQASRYRKRLVKIIPDLLNVLREGLLSIDFPLAQSKNFFNELMRLHEQVLTAVSAPVTAQNNKLADLENVFTDGDAATRDRAWLAPTEAQQSGFMEFADDDPKSSFKATVPQDGDTGHGDNGGGVEPAFEAGETMQSGAWVEWAVSDLWVRAQLTWISPHNTLFMFTSAGGHSHSMTARMVDDLIAQGRFKVISRQGVLDGAFDNVAQTAIRNSVQA